MRGCCWIFFSEWKYCPFMTFKNWFNKTQLFCRFNSFCANFAKLFWFAKFWVSSVKSFFHTQKVQSNISKIFEFAIVRVAIVVLQIDFLFQLNSLNELLNISVHLLLKDRMAIWSKLKTFSRHTSNHKYVNPIK